MSILYFIHPLFLYIVYIILQYLTLTLFYPTGMSWRLNKLQKPASDFCGWMRIWIGVFEYRLLVRPHCYSILAIVYFLFYFLPYYLVKSLCQKRHWLRINTSWCPSGSIFHCHIHSSLTLGSLYFLLLSVCVNVCYWSSVPKGVTRQHQYLQMIIDNG